MVYAMTSPPVGEQQPIEEKKRKASRARRSVSVMSAVKGD
jgi:hypothetical protein